MCAGTGLPTSEGEEAWLELREELRARELQASGSRWGPGLHPLGLWGPALSLQMLVE